MKSTLCVSSIPEFCLQKLFILFSSSAFLPLAIQLLSLAMRVTCITLPNFPLQVVESNDTTPPNSMFQAPGRRRRPRMEALQYLGIVQVFSFPNQFYLVTVAQVMIGAMDDQKRFFGNDYQRFLQLRASLDYIISHF